MFDKFMICPLAQPGAALQDKLSTQSFRPNGPHYFSHNLLSPFHLFSKKLFPPTSSTHLFQPIHTHNLSTQLSNNIVYQNVVHSFPHNISHNFHSKLFHPTFPNIFLSTFPTLLLNFVTLFQHYFKIYIYIYIFFFFIKMVK